MDAAIVEDGVEERGKMGARIFLASTGSNMGKLLGNLDIVKLNCDETALDQLKKYELGHNTLLKRVRRSWSNSFVEQFVRVTQLVRGAIRSCSSCSGAAIISGSLWEWELRGAPLSFI
jgi:hypothetical protein